MTSPQPGAWHPANIGIDYQAMRQLLRDGTASLHTALDAAFETLDLTARGGYERFLCAHFIALAALQPTVDRFVSVTLGMTMPRYTCLLASDLGALGIATDALPRVALPRVALPADARDAAISYVVLGSRLGLAVIGKQPYWGREHDTAHSYIDDRDGLAVWRAFLRWSESAPRTVEAAALVGSARAAFALFAQALSLSARMPQAAEGKPTA